jgi:pimeloyl-ACP methyl ester carboxylesterase
VKTLLGEGYVSETAEVNGTTLHYVRGGQGPAVILIHGFPQDWFEYHAIMPRLAKRFTVIAIDLRGVGGSAVAPDGYDAATMAGDVYQLALTLELQGVYVVGHDIGGMVTYAFVRRYPHITRGAMILDVAIPGIDGWDEIKGDAVLWHIPFMQVPEIPERLVIGRQADFFAYFYNFAKFAPEDIAHYLEAYATPEQLHAAQDASASFRERLGRPKGLEGRNDVVRQGQK